MAVSQFKIFTSADPYAPTLNGLSGSLVNLLDSVLVNGYGNKSPLGWLKPLANDSLTSSLACWRQPSGSGLILYMNDAAPSGSTTSGGREAWVCGYERIVGLTGSTYPTTGTGYGVFPHYSQVFVNIAAGTVPSSSLWWRKSVNIDSNPRPWILFGDDRTFYLFVQAGDTANIYYTYWFGDFYSIKPTNDEYKCLIKGRMGNQTNASAYRFDAGDITVKPTVTTWPHLFAARTLGSGGLGCQLNSCGDMGKNTMQTLTNPAGNGEFANEFSGIIPYPNPPDNSVIISPIRLFETTGVLRGRMRGMYHLCHNAGYFNDNQEFEGTGEFVGRRFRIVKTGPATFAGGTMWVIEISNTVETND